MTLSEIQPKFQAWLRIQAQRLAEQGITANQVKLAAVAGSFTVAALVGALAAWVPGIFLLMPLWLFARTALHDVDAMLGREHGLQGVLGVYLDELGDIVADLALIAPFAFSSPFGGGAVVVFAILTVVAECAGLMGPLVGASRRRDGPLGKRERALVLGVLACWIAVGLGPGRYGFLLWVVLSLLSLATIANRVRCGVREATGARNHSKT